MRLRQLLLAALLSGWWLPAAAQQPPLQVKRVNVALVDLRDLRCRFDCFSAAVEDALLSAVNSNPGDAAAAQAQSLEVPAGGALIFVQPLLHSRPAARAGCFTVPHNKIIVRATLLQREGTLRKARPGPCSAAGCGRHSCSPAAG